MPAKPTDSEKKDLHPVNIKRKTGRQTAVALSDGHDSDAQVPIIKAAGRGVLAEKIIQMAFENGVRVREDTALAEMLATIEIDSPIPTEAFQVVAEILSYVYKADGRPNPFAIEALEEKEHE